MASMDSFHIEDRDSQNRHDQALEYLNEAGDRPNMPRGQDIGKPHIAVVDKTQPYPTPEKTKGSEYVLVTVEELDSKSPKSDNAGEQADTEESSSETMPLQTIPDGNVEVQAYSVLMAKMATTQLQGANDSKALSDAAKPALPERSRFQEAEMKSDSVWSPESEQSEPDNYGFEVREKYYEEEL